MRPLRSHPAYLAGWWTLEGAALLALLSGAVMFAPLGRKNRVLDPGLAEAVALPAASIALAALVLIALLPVPTAAVMQGAGVLANITGIVVLLLLGYRLVVGTADARGFSPDQLTPSLPLLWLALLALSVSIVRLERMRRTEIDTRRRRGRRPGGR